MRATIDNLDEAIMAELENWNEEIKRAVNEGLEETAAVAAETLRQCGPYQERTQKYTKDWTHTITIALREGTNMAYIGNYIGTYLLKESEEKRR